MTFIRDLSFPILAFKQNYLIVAKKAADLEACTGTAWKRRFFDKLLVYDESARKYEVVKAERLGPSGGIWGFRFDLSRWYEIRLSVTPLSGGGLPEARERVLGSVKAPNSAWSASDRLKDVVEGVSNASSIKEIANALDLVP